MEQFKLIEPTTPNAQRFFDTYGGLFAVLGRQYDGQTPAVLLQTCEGKRIMVEKTERGIMVDGEVFCECW
jgi:hypothetical protein